MTIMELGALGEFFGAIAVFATLLFLAIEIRHSSRSADDAAVMMRGQSMREILLLLASDPELSRVYTRWLREDEAQVLQAYERGDEECIRFVNTCLSALVSLQSSWLTDRSSNGRSLTASRLRWQMEQPGCRAVWELYREVHFYEAFRAEIDVLVRDLRDLRALA